jgi:predicted protein tyrosine phosphatase
MEKKMDKKKHLLFICSSGVDRSPAAAKLFEKSKKFITKHAGIFDFARIKLTIKEVNWADYIFVMDEINQRHKTELINKFPQIGDKKIIVLDISNKYARNDERLLQLLKIKLTDWLNSLSESAEAKRINILNYDLWRD